MHYLFVYSIGRNKKKIYKVVSLSGWKRVSGCMEKWKSATYKNRNRIVILSRKHIYARVHVHAKSTYVTIKTVVKM